ncbi:MAG: cation:proton antiporter [Spirochaetia bacterium]|nr:cation:proton antiporter [Spirochaetia bacterium]
MEQTAVLIITAGSILLAGFLAHVLGQKTFIPRVTLLLIFGFLLGPGGFSLLPDFTDKWFPVVSSIALALVGFLLGHNLTRRQIMRRGKSVLILSVSVVFTTALIVFLALFVVFQDVVPALILSVIATATAPAATSDVILEQHSRGKFTSLLLNIVAVDDAWGLILFGVMFSFLNVLSGNSHAGSIPEYLFRELVIAVLIGIVLGLFLAYFSTRIKQREPAVAETLGIVLLGCGLALYFHSSFIITGMVIGMVVSNTIKHHERPFHLVENFEWPVLIFFFILAGASFHLESLKTAGAAGAVYIIFRVAGRILGSWIGGSLLKASGEIKKYMGLALLPQAGVAVGMAMIAVQQFPEYREEILSVTLGATVFFELTGPLFTRYSLKKAGEVKVDASGSSS